MPSPWPALGAALALTIASTGHASSSPAPRKLAVVDVTTPPAMLGLGQQITQTVLVEAKAQGYQLLTPDDLVATLGPKLYEELQNCAGRLECVARKLEPLGSDRAVVGTLGRDEKSYLVRLWLVDLHAHAMIADLDRSIPIASRRLMVDVKLAVPDLLRGKKEARGTLKVVSNVNNAIVTVDGDLAGKTPFEAQLKPGKHEVKLEKKAYLNVTRLVTVEANAVTTEELRLLLIPGEKPEEDVLPTLQAGKGTTRDQGGLRVPLATWLCAGVAVAAAATGAGFGAASAHLQQQLQAGYNAQTQTYAGTRAQALAGKQDALTANLLYAGAGAALAAGVVFTLLDQGGDTVQVAPAAAPGSGGIILEGRF